MPLRRTPPAKAKVYTTYYSPKLRRADLRNLYWAVAEGAPSCSFAADDMEGESLEDFDALSPEPIRKLHVWRFYGGGYMSLGIYPSLAIFDASSVDQDALLVERRVTSVLKGKAQTNRVRSIVTPKSLLILAGQFAFVLSIAIAAQWTSRHYQIGNPTAIYWLTLIITTVTLSTIERKTMPDATIEVGARSRDTGRTIAIIGLIVSALALIGTYIQVALAL